MTYKVGYKRSVFKKMKHDFDTCLYPNKISAEKRKKELKDLGFIQIIIKKGK